MEKRIELERRARKANQIIELNLDNCRSTSIVGLSDEYTALESLSLINVGLTTLKGFPKLPNLKKLELSDNRISNGLNYLTTSPKLQYLNLSGNKIKDLETLKPLEEFKHLAVLDLFNNEATQIDNYREKIFEMLPSLKFLDGFDANDVEAASDGDDDDELNGNEEEEDDKQNAFCLNGIEIDLDELEELERRVRAKRKAATVVSTAGASKDEVDDLDELLKEIKLREDSVRPEPTESIVSGATAVQNRSADAAISKSRSADFASATTVAVATKANADDYNTSHASSLPFALILYWLLAILNLASATYPPRSDDDDCCSSVEQDSDDVSLSEVYNADLEEDNSDWEGEDGAEDDDDDDESDSEGESDAGGDESASAPKRAKGVASAAAKAEADNKDADDAAEDEPQARGKKRKHDG